MLTQLKNPWEMEITSKNFKSEYRKVQEAKVKILRDAFESLFLAEHTYDGLKKGNASNFMDFYYELGDKLYKAFDGGPLKPGPFLPEDITEYLENIENMESPAYSPPLEIDEIKKHLLSLWLYYGFVAGILPTSILKTMLLDVSLIKLMGRVGMVFSLHAEKGQRELVRTKKSTAKVKTKAQDWKETILAIYNHGDKIPPGTSFSKVCKILKGQFEKSKGVKDRPWGEIPKEMKFPSRDTLEGWFKKEKIFDKDFNKRGRFWFTRT